MKYNVIIFETKKNLLLLNYCDNHDNIICIGAYIKIHTYRKVITIFV